MDSSRALITKLVDDGGINEAKRSGIDQTILDESYIPVWNYINKHYGQYKDTPSRDAILKAFPNFEFGSYKEPLQYFVDQLKENYRRDIIETNLERVAKAYTKDTSQAEKLLRETLKDLQVTNKHFRDVDLAKTATDRYEQYLVRKTQPPEDGILSNWSSMDYQTLGWHPEEFIVLVGEKYMGKSWLLVWLAYQALTQNEKVLLLTDEMSQEALARRFDSIYASVKFDLLRRGELSNVEEERYQKKMEQLGDSNFSLMVCREGVSTIEDIKQKAVEVDATIVFTDSVYLFQPSTSQRIANETHKRLEISHECKAVARDLRIPFMVSVQAGRKNTKTRVPDLDDIEWSNAFSQDADTVFYIHKDEIDREINRAQIYLLKSRDGNLCRFYIDQDFEYMDFKQRDDEVEPSTDIDLDEDNDIFERTPATV